MNRGAWQPTVDGVAKSQTQLSTHSYLTIPSTSIISLNILYDNFLYGIFILSQLTGSMRAETALIFFFPHGICKTVHTAGALINEMN